MIYVLCSVVFSVAVAVLLKLSKLRGLDTTQMVAWNYPVAILSTYIFFKPDFSTLEYSQLPWGIYLAVSIILPSLFIVLGLSIQYSGLIKTEVAQRMSLVLSLVAAFLIFQEDFTIRKLIGITLGLGAVLLLIGWQKVDKNSSRSKTMIFPIVVFFGYALVDVLFKLIATHKEVPYVDSLFIVFIGATTLSFLYIVYMYFRSALKLSMSNILSGVLLGIFNFCNILFYMKAHQALSQSPSIVFTGMNIGVIALGTMIGVVFFREKLTLLNIFGLIIAFISVLIIAYS